jgi:hypothetical protein
LDRKGLAALEAAVAASERRVGGEHPATLEARVRLALAYRSCERDARALRERIATGWEQVVAHREQRLGADEPDTQLSRVELAGAYSVLGRTHDAQAVFERVIASWERLAATREQRLGPVHPDTVAARERHAYSHRWVGRGTGEVSLVEQITADHERLLGQTHPRTLHAQVQLASRHFEGNHDVAAAIALGERIINDVHAVLGAEHEDLRSLRATLILAYATSGRGDDAMALAARYPLTEDQTTG